MEMDRRAFLKGAAAVGAISVTAGLAACTTGGTGDGGSTSGGSQATQGGAKTAASLEEKWAFEIPPDPISDADISETITHDIVIIGSGLSGLTTGASAAGHGAKDLVLFSAGTKPLARGGSFHGFNSKYQQSVGIQGYTPEFNKKHIKTEQYMTGYAVNKQLWAKWMNNSEEFINWHIDIMASKGLKPALEGAFVDADGIFTNPPAAHNYWKEGIDDAMRQGAPLVAQALADTITEAGCEIHYSTKALYLLRDGSGPVTGVIAQRDDGSYVKYVANKALILATGDFSKEPDMMAKYSPWAYKTFKDLLFADPANYDVEFEFSGLMPGDGQKMGLWAGAAWQKVYPNAVMTGGSVAGPQNANNYGSFWGINLNINGERYHSENVPGSLAGRSTANQPKGIVFSIWDANYVNTNEKWYTSSTTVDEVVGNPNRTREEEVAYWEENVSGGSWYKSDTIEGLIGQLASAGGLNEANALASVEKYNRWAAQGLDEEFHVSPSVLVPIEKGPFYGAVSQGQGFLTVLGGLRTNAHMQVCDEDDNPIPNLYNVGVMTGDMYGTLYTFTLSGLNLGSTAGCLSYMLGKDLAAL